jgi:hypothetical protein
MLALTKHKKVSKVLILVAFVMVVKTASFCQQTKTDEYTFRVTPIKDSIIEGCPAILLSTVLTNSTNDTLKYINWTCMWNFIYGTDTNKVQVLGPYACDKNIPRVYQVNPGESFTRKFYVFVKRKPIEPKIKFKIFIKLVHQTNTNKSIRFNLESFSNILNDRKQYDILWSNEVSA